MKKLLIVCAAFLLIAQLAACIETSVSLGLSFEKSIIAKKVDGKWQPVENQKFKKGDKIGLVLLNVSGFKKDKNGLNWMDLDVEVKDSNGKIILTQTGLLGESGRMDFKNNVAESPVGSFVTNNTIASGKYNIKVTVHDKIGGGKTENSRSFQLE